MRIRTRAPLRIGLAGGGTDVSPYCELYGGHILNAAIDRYAYVTLDVGNNAGINFFALDLGKDKSFALEESLYPVKGLELHIAVYDYIIEKFNDGKRFPVTLKSFCDAPVGSGLGSSSTLTVALLKAFVELLNLSLDDYELAQTAFHIERDICGFQGGRQDQYAAAFGGVNFMEFYDNNRAIINPLRVKNWILCELEASLLLFFTGTSRESARIIRDSSAKLATGNNLVLDAMHGLKKEAVNLKESLLKGDFEQIVEGMRRGWESKKKCSELISNSQIENVYNTAVQAGAAAGRVSGAGGGGFMIFFVPPENRISVINALKQFPGEFLHCHFCKNGVQGWRLK